MTFCHCTSCVSLAVQLILIRLTCLINAVRSLVQLKSLFLLFLAGFWLLIYLQDCEREAAEAEKGSSDELKSEGQMKLSWALVHSKRPEDVLRGIAMLDSGKIDVAVSIPPCMWIVGHLWLFKLVNDIRHGIYFTVPFSPHTCVNTLQTPCLHVGPVMRENNGTH